MSRLSLALKAFFAILSRGALPADVMAKLGLKKDVPAPAQPMAASAADGALQLLSILQRDARLVDFIMEDISSYADEQVGAAVRQLHASCKETLGRYIALEPVVDGVEGTPARPADAGALAEDPAAIKFTGNLPASGRAASGTLRHRGWKAVKVSLPALPAGGVRVIAAAEIEVE